MGHTQISEVPCFCFVRVRSRFFFLFSSQFFGIVVLSFPSVFDCSTCLPSSNKGRSQDTINSVDDTHTPEMTLKEKDPANDGFDDAEIVELQEVPSPAPEQQLYLYPASESYRPDSVYTSIDGLRSIAVFLMVVRTVIVRFMYGANPLQKAFGGDWLPPIFLYASGARFAPLSSDFHRFCCCSHFDVRFFVTAQTCCRAGESQGSDCGCRGRPEAAATHPCRECCQVLCFDHCGLQTPHVSP